MLTLVYRNQNGIEIINGVDILDCLNAIGATAFVQHDNPAITDPDEIIRLYNEANASSSEQIYKPRRFATDALSNTIHNLIDNTAPNPGHRPDITEKQFDEMEEYLAHLAATDPHNR